jgi:two-component system sensor histidine kinase CpxA
MSRIAVKIFLSFWLTFFLVVTGFSVVLELLRSQDNLQTIGAFQQRQLQQHMDQIKNIYQRRGLQGLRRFAQDIEDNRGTTLFLMNEAGEDILNKNVPASVQGYFKNNRQLNTAHMQMREQRLLLGPQTFPDAALPAQVLLWLPMASHETLSMSSLWQGRYGVWQVALGVLFSGIVSLILALSLTRPLSRLERAASRLAQGHFETADIDTVASRKDEIGTLAKEFSHMAARLHSALESQQRLLRDVSHELRSPLTRLQVAIGLASRQAPADTPMMQASFDRMEAECERLNALIGEVLALARADSADKQATQHEFDLVATLQALTTDAKFEAQAHQKDVKLEAPARLPFWGDENALASAIENVVRNAIHYTSANSVVLISLASSSNGAEIKVLDAGPGLPEAELSKIFVPFYRVSEARERTSGGTGVGLAIAARVVQQHGGQIVARNRPGGGLEIYIRLPKTSGRSNIRVT